MSKRMSKDEWKTPQPAVGEGSGAKGGKDVLRSEEQRPVGVEPDSEIDEKLTRTKGAPSKGLNPNTIVRN